MNGLLFAMLLVVSQSDSFSLFEEKAVKTEERLAAYESAFGITIKHIALLERSIKENDQISVGIMSVLVFIDTKMLEDASHQALQAMRDMIEAAKVLKTMESQSSALIRIESLFNRHKNVEIRQLHEAMERVRILIHNKRKHSGVASLYDGGLFYFLKNKITHF